MDDLTRRSFGHDASNVGNDATRFGGQAMPFKRASGHVGHQAAARPSSSSTAQGGFYTDSSLPFSVAIDSSLSRKTVAELTAELEEMKQRLQRKEQEIATLSQQCAQIPKLKLHYQQLAEKAAAALTPVASAAATGAAGAGIVTPRTEKKVTISPNIFSVTKHHGVQRLQLARCASMGTQRSLQEQESRSGGASASDGIAERVIQVRTEASDSEVPACALPLWTANMRLRARVRMRFLACRVHCCAARACVHDRGWTITSSGRTISRAGSSPKTSRTCFWPLVPFV